MGNLKRLIKSAVMAMDADGRHKNYSDFSSSGVMNAHNRLPSNDLSSNLNMHKGKEFLEERIRDMNRLKNTVVHHTIASK